MPSEILASPIVFTGEVEVEVEGQDALPDWQQKALTAALDEGLTAPQQLRFLCAIAKAANNTFERLDTSLGSFALNPASKAQFGRNAEGQAYLTLGLVDLDTGDRFRLHWEGDAIPPLMKEVAVRHDEGKKVPRIMIPLRLDGAKVWKLGEKSGKRVNDPRRNHDTGPDGLPYPRPPRRHHGRLCSKDLLK